MHFFDTTQLSKETVKKQQKQNSVLLKPNAQTKHLSTKREQKVNTAHNKGQSGGAAKQQKGGCSP